MRSLAAAMIVAAVTMFVRPAVAEAQPRPGPSVPTGTAIIRGRITAADSGRPLRRALIVVTSLERVADRHTISTSADGRYEIADLPAGRYNIAASRSGYLTLRYGQSRPLEIGKPIQVLDKQVIEKVDFALPKMGVIAGRVTDEAAEAIAGARVLVMRTTSIGGQQRLGVVDHTSTDDAGQYRVVNLPPGSYFVLATSKQTWTIIERDVEQKIGYSPTYWPGSVAVQGAGRIQLGIGQVADAISFSMSRGRVAAVSGTALDSRGRPLAGETIGLTQEFPNAGTAASFQLTGTPVEADGSFTLRDVPPGDYKLVMRYVVRDGSGAHVEEAGAAPLAVTGADMRAVRFTTSRGGTITGQVLTDRGVVPDISRNQLAVVSQPIVQDPDLKVGGIDDSGVVKEDGTFFVAGIFGRTRIRATLPDGWVLKSVLRDGRDITDDPIAPGSRETISGIQVIVSEQISTITGQVTDDRGMPIDEGTVIVFHRDSEKWEDPNRYVHAVRPDQQGQFTIRGLPPGEYLALAEQYVPAGQWTDPDYLASIRRYGQRVAVSEGAAQAISLKLINP